MDNRKIVEIIGVAAVVISLIFVGVELNQNTRASTSEARISLSNQALDWLELITTDELMHKLWTRGWQQGAPIEEFTEIERSKAGTLMRLNLRRLENVYLQYEQGVIDESAFDSYGFPRSDVQTYTSDRFRDYWNNSKDGFNLNFVEFFEARLEL